MMSRKTAREIAVQLVFSLDEFDGAPEERIQAFFDPEYFAGLAQVDTLYTELPDETQREYISRLVNLVCSNRVFIDRFISTYARGWELSRISRTALAILRCAICEILYMEDIPDGAAINEAVELDKGYDEPDTVSFVNGVLGSFYRAEVAGNK